MLFIKTQCKKYIPINLFLRLRGAVDRNSVLSLFCLKIKSNVIYSYNNDMKINDGPEREARKEKYFVFSRLHEN